MTDEHASGTHGPRSVRIVRDGRTIISVPDVAAARRWFLKNETFTLSHALKHGYRIVDAKDRDLLVTDDLMSFNVREIAYPEN